jgi:hypothetical protein
LDNNRPDITQKLPVFGRYGLTHAIACEEGLLLPPTDSAIEDYVENPELIDPSEPEG